VKECNLAWKEIKKRDAEYIEKEIKMFFNSTLLVTRTHWQYILQPSSSSKMPVIQPTPEQLSSSTIEPAPNAISQKYATRSIIEAQKKWQQYVQMINISDDADLRRTL